MSQIPIVAQRLSEALPKAQVHARVGHLAPDELVVGGLADTVGYDRISLHRPAYDFVLEWDGGRRVIYEADSPLYQSWRVALGHTFLGHDWYGGGHDRPDGRTAPSASTPRRGAGPSGPRWWQRRSRCGRPAGAVRPARVRIQDLLQTAGSNIEDGAGKQYACAGSPLADDPGVDHELGGDLLTSWPT